MSLHNAIRNEVANALAAKGYSVEIEKWISNRRVDVYAEREKTRLVVEVVNTHYSGPLDITQLKILIDDTGKKFRRKFRHKKKGWVNISVSRALYERVKRVWMALGCNNSEKDLLFSIRNQVISFVWKQPPHEYDQDNRLEILLPKRFVDFCLQKLDKIKNSYYKSLEDLFDEALARSLLSWRIPIPLRNEEATELWFTTLAKVQEVESLLSREDFAKEKKRLWTEYRQRLNELEKEELA